MRKKLLCGLMLTAALGCALLGSACGADVIYVRAGAPPGGDGQTWATAYASLQFGLSAAQSGDEIWVAAGTYKPTTGTDRRVSFVMKQGVSLYGGFPAGGGDWESRDWTANETILSGDIGATDDPYDNSYRVVLGADNAALDGFIITGGNADGTSDPERRGGGMYNDYGSPTVTNCSFTDNSAIANWGGGGGMNNLGGSPTVTECAFTGNSGYYGGGMRNGESNPTVTDCAFTDNSAVEYGGGMYNYWSSPTVTECAFTDNSAVEYGGGMANYGGAPKIADCMFTGNLAADSGGMDNNASAATVVNCAFVGNSVFGSGGGMYNYLGGDPEIINCTFTANEAEEYAGGGMFNYQSSPTVTNCIVWANAAPVEPQISGPGIVTYTNVQGGLSGDGNINADPLFVQKPSPGPDGVWGTEDDDYGDVRLQSGSPCIDAGDNSAVPPWVFTDLDGNQRIWDGNGDGQAVVDMGAYEYGSEPLLPFIISEAKLLADGAFVFIEGAIVSAPEYLDYQWQNFFYISADDRSSGLRVEKDDHGLQAGIRVDIAGTMRMNADGERYIEAVSLTPAGSGSVKPLMMVNRSLGGGDWNYNPATGEGQKGVKNGVGLNNIGLFVSVFGRVTHQGLDFVYIDDGSALNDGSGHTGVKAVGVDVPPDLEGKYVRIEGIVSCFKDGDDLHPVILITDGELFDEMEEVTIRLHPTKERLRPSEIHSAVPA